MSMCVCEKAKSNLQLNPDWPVAFDNDVAVNLLFDGGPALIDDDWPSVDTDADDDGIAVSRMATYSGCVGNCNS